MCSGRRRVMAWSLAVDVFMIVTGLRKASADTGRTRRYLGQWLLRTLSGIWLETSSAAVYNVARRCPIMVAGADSWFIVFVILCVIAFFIKLSSNERKSAKEHKKRAERDRELKALSAAGGPEAKAKQEYFQKRCNELRQRTVEDPRWAAWRALTTDQKRAVILEAFYRQPVTSPPPEYRGDGKRAYFGSQCIDNAAAIDLLLNKGATRYDGRPIEVGVPYYSWTETADESGYSSHSNEISEMPDPVFRADTVYKIYRTATNTCFKTEEIRRVRR